MEFRFGGGFFPLHARTGYVCTCTLEEGRGRDQSLRNRAVLFPSSSRTRIQPTEQILKFTGTPVEIATCAAFGWHCGAVNRNCDCRAAAAAAAAAAVSQAQQEAECANDRPVSKTVHQGDSSDLHVQTFP